MLTLVGLGLCDGKDITVRGKEAVATAQHVYLESYTSLLQCDHEELEEQLGCTIRRLDRTAIELDIDKVLKQAEQEDVVILVIGDVFGATTHTDLYLRGRELGIPVKVIHNASILNAVGSAGLELYRFGKTVSVPYWLPGSEGTGGPLEQRTPASARFEPTSYLDGIKENQERGLHTLVLLDIKADEGRFMSVEEGIEHLMKAEAVKKYGIIHDGTLLVGMARIGCPDQMIVAAPIALLRQREFGSPPHCIIIPGKLHHIEEQMLALWK